ncbi:MAG TPA: cation:proton antiporter [Longimicrobiaceae bacterium]|nr:cation:proton antiporter [Longimicrobiaceae bacterium]
MIGLALLLVASAAAFGIARLLRLPAVPFLLVAGLVMRVFGALPERELLEDAVQLGLAVLVFAAGIELNPRRVGSQARAAVRVGFLQFVLLATAGFGAVTLLGADFQQAIYLSLALAASSTLLVVRLLQQRKQMFEPFGRLVLGVLLIQDMLVILLLPILVGVPEGIGEVVRGLGTIAVLVAAAFASIRWLAPFLILRLDLDEEGLLLVTLALLFLFMGAASWLGLPLIAGAFLGGVALSSFPINGIVRGQLQSLTDFFLAIFLTALGGLIGVPTWSDLGIALILTLLVVVLTPPLVTVIAEAAGLSARASIDAGLLLAQTSEFSLVVALQGWATGHLPESGLTIVVIVTMATMFLTPFIATDRMTWRLMAYHPLRHRGEFGEPPSGHVLLLGCGDNGMPLLETLLGAGHSVVVVDDDPSVIEALQEGDVPCIRGDGSDFDVLQRAGAQNAAVVISTMRRPRDSLHVLRRIRNVPVLVRVFDDDDAKRIARHGGIPISYADAATEDFFSWLDQAAAIGLTAERRTRPRKGSSARP